MPDPKPTPGLRAQIADAVEAIRHHTDLVPEVGIICGTGMGELGDKPKGLIKIPYDKIPHFPRPTVETHHGFLCFGELGSRRAAIMRRSAANRACMLNSILSG